VRVRDTGLHLKQGKFLIEVQGDLYSLMFCSKAKNSKVFLLPCKFLHVAESLRYGFARNSLVLWKNLIKKHREKLALYLLLYPARDVPRKFNFKCTT
jgi:hypothetical protein